MTSTGGNTRSDLIQPGQSFGKFYIVQVIGEGGTSLIFKALQQPISRVVALKIPSFTENGTLLTPDEFLSEATLMARLEHPNIVRIYDFGVTEDRAFICMEYVEGSNLLELHQSAAPLSISGILAIAMQTLDALMHSHSHGVMHLDLAPANVLITKTGVVKLLDFGMAGKKPPTAPGKVIGTPAFLSPEHVQGKTCTPKSDLFSFGSLLYFIATGEQLFDPGESNSNLAEMLRAISAAREFPPALKIGKLPKTLGNLVLGALSGTEAEQVSRDLKKAWALLEGESSPAFVLKLELERHEDAQRNLESAPPDDQSLSERYFKLRESGRHREAVSLLEDALRRDPNNPLLQELLTAPPAKSKSTPATMAISGSTTSKLDARVPFTSKLFPLVVGTLVMAVGFLILDKCHGTTQMVSAPKDPAKTADTADVANTGDAADTARTHRDPIVDAAIPVNHTRTPKIMVLKQVKRPGLLATHKSPALAISGQSGIKVSLNDSGERISPSPKGGWNLEPGLLNVTLTLPGNARPINSSLFLFADTLYTLRVDDDGGFSVSREHR